MIQTKESKYFFSFFLSIVLIFNTINVYASVSKTSKTEYVGKTSYARDFIAKAEDEKWFLDEIERLLNLEQKTVETITGRESFKNIKYLGLKGKNITGEIPEAIGELENLEYIYLSNNSITGKLPDSIYTLKKLKNLDVSHNEIEETLTNKFDKLPKLEVLKLNNNKYTGSVPSELLNSDTIRVIDLSQNEITGNITLGSSTVLEYLGLSGIDFSQFIADVSGYPNLEVFSAWNSNLTMHDSIYNLNKIEIIDIASNEIEGTISSKFGDLTTLKVLSLGDNLLEEIIPKELEKLVNLELLDLEKNKLTGHMPEKLKDIEKIYLNDNYLTGEAIKEIEYNQNNFIDGETNNQFDLTAPEKLRITNTEYINIYDYLKNIPMQDKDLKKPLLSPNKYKVNVLSKAELLDIKINDKGIFIKSKAEQLDSAIIEVKIKNNKSSDYSKTTIELTTANVTNPPGGGGGTGPGGGGGNPNPDPENPDPENPNPDGGGSGGSGGTGTGGNGNGGNGNKDIIKYISGYPDSTFMPKKSITREEVCKVIIDALELNVSENVKSSFTDVEENRWSNKYIEKAYELGYIKGYPDNTFRPKEPMTRAEIATVLAKISDEKNLKETAEIKFTDVYTDKWYTEYIKTASKRGLISGYEDGSFKPENDITRAETVSIINRLLGQNNIKTEDENPFKDLYDGYWAYDEILTAAEIYQK